MFAQETIKFSEVAQEVEAVRTAIGSGVDVAAFCRAALRHYKASITDVGSGIRARIEVASRMFHVRFATRCRFPAAVRTSMRVSSCRSARRDLSASHAPAGGSPGHWNSGFFAGQHGCHRRGAMRSRSHRRQSIAGPLCLLVRLRYHIETEIKSGPRGKSEKRGRSVGSFSPRIARCWPSPDLRRMPEWLSKEQAEALLEAIPDANIAPELQRDALQRILDGVPALMPHLESAARSRAAELLEAHRRVRSAARLRGVSQRVEPQLPPDILGIYVFLPVPAAGGQA